MEDTKQRRIKNKYRVFIVYDCRIGSQGNIGEEIEDILQVANVYFRVGNKLMQKSLYLSAGIRNK